MIKLIPEPHRIETYYRLRKQLGKYEEVDDRHRDKDDIRVIYQQDQTQKPPPDL